MKRLRRVFGANSLPKVIILVDPARNMKHQKTGEVTPALTFMPRALEWEAYDDERRWQFPEPSETYLDPPPPHVSKGELRKRKKEITKQKIRSKGGRLRGKLKKDGTGKDGGEDARAPKPEEEIESSSASDSEYDDDYQKELRADYGDPRPYTRHRDYARKYAWSTFELLHQGLADISTAEMLQGGSAIPPLITRLCLDDLWQLLAEMRLGLDQVDNDLGADLHLHLLENLGTKTRLNVVWMRSTLREIHEWARHLLAAPPAVSHSEDMRGELAALVDEVEALRARTESTSGLLASFVGLSQSSLVIDQTSGVNKLTELAFFFVPLSFITSVFSMQVLEFTTAPPPIWAWGVSLSVVFLICYLLRISLRSPSVRLFAMRCRVTMLNRFTSSQARSPSRRLNSVGNIAIARFLVFFVTVCSFIIGLLCLVMALLFLVFAGIWLGAAATALYFIITRWPETGVLIPCFLALVLAAGGLWASWYWREEILILAERWMVQSSEWLKDALPADWTIDRVDDEDLAKEGIKTYARQAIVLASS